MRKALITGGAGFIGGHLTKRLLDDGYQRRPGRQPQPGRPGRPDRRVRVEPGVLGADRRPARPVEPRRDRRRLHPRLPLRRAARRAERAGPAVRGAPRQRVDARDDARRRGTPVEPRAVPLPLDQRGLRRHPAALRAADPEPRDHAARGVAARAPPHQLHALEDLRRGPVPPGRACRSRSSGRTTSTGRAWGWPTSCPSCCSGSTTSADGDELVVYSIDHQRTFCFIDDAVEYIARLLVHR